MASSAATARPTTAATRKRLRTSATSDSTSVSSRTATTEPKPSGPTGRATITESPSNAVTGARWPRIPWRSVDCVKRGLNSLS